MRPILFASALLILGLPRAGCSKSRKDDAKLVEDAWLPATAELAGQEFPQAVLKTMKRDIKGGNYTVHVGEQADIGTVRMMAGQTHKAMDITGTQGPNKGKTFLAI